MSTDLVKTPVKPAFSEMALDQSLVSDLGLKEIKDNDGLFKAATENFKRAARNLVESGVRFKQLKARLPHGEFEDFLTSNAFAPQRAREATAAGIPMSELAPLPALKLEWSATLCDGKSVDYAAAEKACSALGEGWRLPTRMELESILDLTRHDPAIDIARFPDTKSAWYWTSTPCAWASSCAWVVYFYGGYAYDSDRHLKACVRAVRVVSAGQ